MKFENRDEAMQLCSLIKEQQDTVKKLESGLATMIKMYDSRGYHVYQCETDGDSLSAKVAQKFIGELRAAAEKKLALMIEKLEAL